MRASRGFASLGLILTILIGAAIFAGAAYYASKSVTQSTALDTTLLDTTDWKVYDNQQYGFGFKYPSALQVIDGSPRTDTSGTVKVINIVAKHSSTSSGTTSFVYGMGFTIRGKDQIDLLKIGTGNIQSTQTIQLNGIQMTVYHSQIVVQANGHRADEQAEEAIFRMRDYAFKLHSSSSDSDSSPYFYTILSTVH